MTPPTYNLTVKPGIFVNATEDFRSQTNHSSSQSLEFLEKQNNTTGSFFNFRIGFVLIISTGFYFSFLSLYLILIIKRRAMARPGNKIIQAKLVGMFCFFINFISILFLYVFVAFSLCCFAVFCSFFPFSIKQWICDSRICV